MTAPEFVFVVSEGMCGESEILAAYLDESKAEAEVARLRELNKDAMSYGCGYDKVIVK
jgi:hypothetical protein